MVSSTTWGYACERLNRRVRGDVPVLPPNVRKWYSAVLWRGGNVPRCTAVTNLAASSSARGVGMSTDQRDGGRAGDVQGPTVPRLLVGIQLHRFRDAAGITPDQAAYEIRASRSKISRMENGLVRFKERDVTDLLSLYGITDELI